MQKPERLICAEAVVDYLRLMSGCDLPLVSVADGYRAFDILKDMCQAKVDPA